MLSDPLRQRFEDEALPHLDALYGMAVRLTQDPREAEDLVQDALVKAYRFFDQYQQGTNIKAWLFRVLINTFHNTKRKSNNISRLHYEAEPNYEQFMSAATSKFSQLEEAVLDRLFAEHLMGAVEELPQEFRAAVVLCDFMEFSYKEIADILDCPVGTVMSRLYRGRRLLQKMLHDYAVDQGLVKPVETAGERAGAGTTDLQAFRRRKGKR